MDQITELPSLRKAFVDKASLPKEELTGLIYDYIPRSHLRTILMLLAMYGIFQQFHKAKRRRRKQLPTAIRQALQEIQSEFEEELITHVLNLSLYLLGYQRQTLQQIEHLASRIEFIMTPVHLRPTSPQSPIISLSSSSSKKNIAAKPNKVSFPKLKLPSFPKPQLKSKLQSWFFKPAPPKPQPKYRYQPEPYWDDIPSLSELWDRISPWLTKYIALIVVFGFAGLVVGWFVAINTTPIRAYAKQWEVMKDWAVYSIGFFLVIAFIVELTRDRK